MIFRKGQILAKMSLSLYSSQEKQQEKTAAAVCACVSAGALLEQTGVVRSVCTPPWSMPGSTCAALLPLPSTLSGGVSPPVGES